VGKLEIKIKTLTPLWTGGVDTTMDRIHETGILGSLRWWYEAIVRGLGGRACDPTVKEVRCQYDPQNPRPPESQLCVVCCLFGCTGWARKFRLMVLDEQENVIQEQIQAGQTFILRFIPLRPIAPEEWCLLDATLRLIADYGALGGKTVFKPSDETNRQNAFHHRDFGLIQYEGIVKPENWTCIKSLDDLKRYVSGPHWRQDVPYRYRGDKGQEHDYSWVSLQNFWCVKGRYLARRSYTQSSYNRVLGRNMRKNRAQDLWQDTPVNRWLAGSQQKSKKVFGFKEPEEARRTFGFVKPGLVDFEEMKRRLEQVWQGFNSDSDFLTGDQVLKQLFQQEGSA